MSKKPFKPAKHILSRIKRDKKGNVGIIFGLVLVPIVIAMGAAVDYSRAFLKQKDLASAVDTAVLAGGIYSDGSQSVFEDKIKKTLYANFPEAEVDTLTFNRDSVTKAVTVTATSKVDTVFAGIWNVDNVPIQAAAEAKPGRSYAEIVLVLDNTGSMGSSGKITALKTAAKDLVQILNDSSPDTSKLFISLVPFTTTVRLSSDLLSWNGIDFNGLSSVSGEDFDGNRNVMDIYSDMNIAWNGCVRARPSGNDLNDTPATPGLPETLYPIYLAPDEPDGRYYNDGTFRPGVNGNSYRNRYINDSFLEGTKPNGPERQRDTAKYNNTVSLSSSRGPENNCPAQPILPLTTNKSTLDNAIDGMTADGYTNIATGLAWGWRMLTPEEPYAARDFDQETKKFIILLTDGKQETGSASSGPRHNETYYTAYGYAAKGHLGNVNGSESVTVLDSKVRTLCEKAKGLVGDDPDAPGATYDSTREVKIFTITFQLSNATTQTLFRNCATTPQMYYNSPDNATLQTTFQEIANELIKLSLTK
jgi:Flp pilus assembly protein TadG